MNNIKSDEINLHIHLEEDQSAHALCQCDFISRTVQDCSSISYEMTSRFTRILELKMEQYSLFLANTTLHVNNSLLDYLSQT